MDQGKKGEAALGVLHAILKYAIVGYVAKVTLDSFGKDKR